MSTVGFIGTGNIGTPMARHLLDTGHTVVVHDRRPEASADLLERGAVWAESPAAVAEQCRIVFTSLPGPAEVEEVVTGPTGILAAARPGDAHVDLSSNSLAMVRRLAAREATAGVRYLDSPVTGGVRGAEAGTLTVLASGERAAFDQVEELLQTFGKNVCYLGEAGTGCLVKLINNLIVLCTGQLMQEGLVLGVKAGIDPARLYELLKISTAAPLVRLMPYVLGRRFTDPTFTLALAEKDVALALEAARTLAVPMPVTTAAHQTYVRARAMDLGERSFLATFEALEAAAGVHMARVEIDEGQARL